MEWENEKERHRERQRDVVVVSTWDMLLVLYSTLYPSSSPFSWPGGSVQFRWTWVPLNRACTLAGASSGTVNTEQARLGAQKGLHTADSRGGLVQNHIQPAASQERAV